MRHQWIHDYGKQKMSTPQAPPLIHGRSTPNTLISPLSGTIFWPLLFCFVPFGIFYPPAFELFSLNLLATPVIFIQQNGSFFGNSRVVDVLHVKKLSNNFKSSIIRCSCDKYGVNMYKLRSRATADVQQQNVTASNSKTPEIILALAQYAPESLRCWETCVFSVPIHSSLY